MGNKPAAKKPAAKYIFRFLAPQTHNIDFVPLPAILFRYFIIETQKVSIR